MARRVLAINKPASSGKSALLLLLLSILLVGRSVEAFVLMLLWLAAIPSGWAAVQ